MKGVSKRIPHKLKIINISEKKQYKGDDFCSRMIISIKLSNFLKFLIFVGRITSMFLDRFSCRFELLLCSVLAKCYQTWKAIGHIPGVLLPGGEMAVYFCQSNNFYVSRPIFVSL